MRFYELDVQIWAVRCEENSYARFISVIAFYDVKILFSTFCESYYEIIPSLSWIVIADAFLDYH